jgi:class III poly(R)-hydroxyalkanoic acid synthase PhaE subunit
LATLAQDSHPVAREVAQRLVNNQLSLLRLLDLATQAWSAVLPHLGESTWQSYLQEQTAAIRDELRLRAQEATYSAPHLSEAQRWTIFMKEEQSAFLPWVGHLTTPPSAVNDEQALPDLMSLYWDTYRETFGSLLQTPRLTYRPHLLERLRAAFGAWQAFHQASYAYHLYVGEVWVAAFEKLLSDLAELTRAGESVESLRDFLNRWSATADQTFKTAFRSADYITHQSALINHLMHYRYLQGLVNDLALQAYDLPTRAEMDEAHRRIHDLRREVKNLKRELAALRRNGKGSS